MTSLKHTVARNTVWTGLDTVVDFLLQTTTGILVARAIGPSMLGAWGYVLWISAMTVAVGNFGVPAALIKYLGDLLGQRRFAEIPGLLRRTVFFQATISVVLTGIGLTWARYFLPLDQRTFGALTVLSILPAGMLGIATAINAAMERLRSNAIPSIAGIVVQTSLNLATLVCGWGLVGLATALLLGRTCDSLLRWRFALRWLPEHLRGLGYDGQAGSGRLPLDRTLRRGLVLFCTHATILLVLRLVVWNRSEVFFLKQFCSLDQLAFYAVATGFAALPTQLATPFVTATSPSIYAERGRGSDGARRFTAVSWRYLALIVFPSSVGLLVLSRPLIHVLYGPKYFAAAPVLICAMALGLLPPLAQPANSLIAAENGQSLLVRWNVVAALLVLGLDWLLVGLFCSTGAALADGLGRTIATLGVWYIAARWFKLKLPFRFAGRLFLACLVMAAPVLPFLLIGPELLAVIAGPLVGAVAFVVGVRMAKVLDADDVDRLRALEKVLPRKARIAFLKVLAWMGRTSLKEGA